MSQPSTFAGDDMEQVDEVKLDLHSHPLFPFVLQALKDRNQCMWPALLLSDDATDRWLDLIP